MDARFKAATTERTIEDLKVKMELIKGVPVDQLYETFGELCDLGRMDFFRSERSREPGLSDKEILVAMIDRNRLTERKRGKRHGTNQAIV